MIIDFLTVNLKNKINDEIQRAQSAETELRLESFADVEYDSSAATINFFNSLGDKIGEIDATDFIIDGMIENVTLSGNILTISFNTAAGKQDIVIDLSEFINPENYYTKTEIDTTLSGLCQDIEQSFSAVTEDIVSLSGDVDERVSEVERVTSIALNELNDNINTLSGQAENYVTSAQVETQITSAMTDSVYSTTIHNIVSISQADYDLLPVKDPNTLYVIINNS